MSQDAARNDSQPAGGVPSDAAPTTAPITPRPTHTEPVQQNLGDQYPNQKPDQPNKAEPSDCDSSPLILPLVRDGEDPPTVVSKKSGSNSGVASSAGISALLQGAKLAHFELISPLGSGGMGAVLLARDTQLDRPVALKILPPENATDPESVQRFHQEARSAARLDHDHIVRVFFCGEDQGLHFIAFEYVQGETLKSLLDRKGRIDEADALLYLEQLALALIHASQRGVVHRDIKPSNVLITPENKAKLVDMGLARSFGPRDNGLTQSGVTLGTFDYISPEQALDPRTADPRSDIYSLGCTFYHVLTGKAPVPDGPPAMKLAHHQQVMPADPREYVPGMDPRLVSLLSEMMAKDPDQRPASAEVLLERVSEIRQKPAGGSRLWLPAKAIWSETRRGQKRERSIHLAMASMALVILAIVVGILRLIPEPKTEEPDKPINQQFASLTTEGGKEPPSPPQGGPNNAGRPAEPRSRVAVYQPHFPSLADLREWLARQGPTPEIELKLSGDLDLSGTVDSSAGGIQLQAKRVVIRAADPARPARIIFRNHGGISLAKAMSALSIDAETIEISDVHFLVDAHVGGAKLDALLLRPTRQAELRRCFFFQAQKVLDERFRLTSLRIDNQTAADPIVRLQECVFLGFKTADSFSSPARFGLKGAERGGQDALVRTGNVDLHLEQCAMGPHERVITLDRALGPLETSVRILQCTAILGQGNDFLYVDASAQPAINLTYSLIAKAESKSPVKLKPLQQPSALHATLIHVNDEIGQFTFRGTENRYYKIDSYFEEGKRADSSSETATFDGFRNHLAMLNRGEDESRVLESAPFKNPGALAALQLELGETNKADTFTGQAKDIAGAFAALDNVRDLRPEDNPTNRLVGVERCGPFDFLATKLPVLEPKRTVAAKPMEPGLTGKARIVDPDMDDSTNRIYPSLEQAIAASRSGDEILIRHQGPPLRCKAVQLDDPALSLTIRAHPGFHPILTLQSSKDENGSLFRLDGAKLRLEELEFAVEPTQSSLKSLSLATLARPGYLSINRCTVTLDPSRKSTPLALVTMLDTTGMMRMEEQDATKLWKVELDQTIVRGSGNLVSNPVGRPIEVDARQSLFSLEGSVLAFDPAPTAGKNLEGNEGVTLRWNKNTSWLTGPFLRLQALGGSLSIPFNTTIRDSLVAMKPGNTPLIRMEGISAESPMAKLPDRFHWEEMGNTYANLTDMVVTTAPGSQVEHKVPNNDQWKSLSNDSSARFLDHLDPPGQTRMMPYLSPVRWTPLLLANWKIAAHGAGADLDQLPNPTTTKRD